MNNINKAIKWQEIRLQSNEILTMLVCILPTILIAGLFFIIFKNSPKHGYYFLMLICFCVVISFIKVIQLWSVLVGIIGLFILAIQSRKVREQNVLEWFVNNGFVATNFPSVKSLFDASIAGTNNCWAYKNELITRDGKIPFLLAISCHSQRSSNTTTIVYHCAYYFKEGIEADSLEKKLQLAKKNTPRTNFLTSQFGYFNVKDVAILRPATGGVVARWRVPHSPAGYAKRFEWIKNAINNR